jgi:membrane-associated phospholipid phosphatase
MRILLVTLFVQAVLGRPARADERVPLAHNFSRAEQVSVASVATVDVLLFAFQEHLVSAVRAERDGPLLGAPWAWDRQVSASLYRGPQSGRFLYGVPDVGGEYVLPSLALGFYGLDGLSLWLRDQSLSGSAHADHELVAFTEAFGLTVLATQVAKLSIGRTRPRYALGRIQDDPDDDERDLSFFSGHTSVSFCLAAFVHRDVSDWLSHDALRSRSPATRFWLGRVAPGVVLYGAASLIGVSRIVDQRHYVTDVAVGALVGGILGHVIYAWHFDGAGRPNRRLADRASVKVVAVPGGLSLSGQF